MPTRHGGSFWKNARTVRRFNWRRMSTWPAASTPCTWKTDLAMTRPIVVIDCMGRSVRAVRWRHGFTLTHFANRG